MQKLILPIQKALVTAGYQNEAYRNRFGFKHYGHDMVSATADRTVLASGDGIVLATGTDNVLGLVLIIAYSDAYNNQTKVSSDIVFRYFHLQTVFVKVGTPVKRGTPIGIYGSSGRYSTGAHLHLEVDRDTKYFLYSPTVGRDGTFIKAGKVQTMFCPANTLYTAQSTPYGQTCLRSNASYGGIPYVAASELPPALV